MHAGSPIGKTINAVAACILTFSVFGVNFSSGHFSTSFSPCSTSPVLITLASEQLEFCSPTSLPYNVTEDDRTISSIGYAGLDQFEGYGFMTIRAASPGSAPGPGWPVYTSNVAAYSQVVLTAESSHTDQSVSPGPSAELWGESIPSIQIDFTLVTSDDEIPLRTVEWFIEHNARLWLFSLTWDVSMPNELEWEQSAANFSVRPPSQLGLPDNAVDLGQAHQQDPPDGLDEMQAQGVGDVNLPTWWDGAVCDFDNYLEATGLASTPLGSPWHGVYACGTNPISAMEDAPVVFFPGAWGQFEFECVELVMRFLYLQWGIPPFQGNGSTIKDHAPSSLVFYANDGTHPIAAGDILTEDPLHTGWSGHAVVVIGVHLDGSGTGTIDILEQNSIQSGHRSMNVHNWIVDPDSWVWGQTVQGWLHAKANISDGDLDSSFASTGSGLNGPINAVGFQSSGRVVIGGEFTGYDSTSRSHIARLNVDGSLDGTFDPGDGISSSSGNPQVYTLKIQTSDDKVLVGGFFDHYGSASVKNVLRLDSNGGIDAAFTPPAAMTAASGDPNIRALAVQSDGKILIGGNFNSLDSTTHNYLARLGAAGSVDTVFSPSLDGVVYALLLQLDGKIIIGGAFSHVGAVSRSGIARLNSDGSLDTTFAPGTGTLGQVTSLALQNDKIIIGGNFSSYNGISRNMIARLNSNGSLDTTFLPGTGVAGTDANLQSVVLQPDGRILIGGKFSSYNGVTAYNFIRLNNDGTRDLTFFPRGDFATDDTLKVVHAVLLQSNNKILLAGNFSTYLTRLLNHVEPCYALAVSLNPPGGGTVDVSPSSNCPGSTYFAGTSVTLTAIPETENDFWFLNWSGDASGTVSSLVVSMTAGKSISANFLHSPFAFTKSSPANGSSNQPADVTLSWGASTGATSYEYCYYISTNDCDSRAWTTVGAAQSVTLTSLLPSTIYHWQVRARNQVDTTDAGPEGQRFWSFTRSAVPAVPVTVSPDGVLFIDNPRPFIWNVSPGALLYEMVIHPLFSSPDLIYDHLSASSVCSSGLCTYHLPISLVLGDYEFKVSASATGSPSAYSSWRTFTVVSVGAKFFLPLIMR
jgi:uncharacterized delta-60 repeat protein